MIGFQMDLLALMNEMGRLPDQLDAAVRDITRESAQTFEGRMLGQFPGNDDTGELRRSTASAQSSPLGWKVVNEAFYANWYEQGFMHHTTDGGAEGRTARGQRRGLNRRRNLGRGVQVSGQNIWIPEAMQTRAAMFDELRAVMTVQRGLPLQVLAYV